MKTKYIYLFVMSVLAFLTACSNEDYKLYDTSQQDAVFVNYYDTKGVLADSVIYEYGYDTVTVHPIVIPIKLMGMPANHNRTFDVEQVKLENVDNMTEGTHYSIDKSKLVISADSVSGCIIVNLLRNNDPSIQQRQFSLKLQLKATTDLRPIGQTTFLIRYDDIRPSAAPSWWATWAMPTYRFDIAQKFFAYFYATKTINPSVFNEMVTRYGDYFVKAVSMQGPLAMYSNFLAKYVLIPLYEDTKNDPTIVWPRVPSIY
jgi:hypothetical protein